MEKTMMKRMDIFRIRETTDKLKHGVQVFESDNEKELLYMFLAKYVRKTHLDSEIKLELKNNEGM